MKLADHRFFRNNLRRGTVEQSYAVTRYGYETTGDSCALYDVDIRDDDGTRTYHVNMGAACEPMPIHRAIEAHYNVRANG